MRRLYFSFRFPALTIEDEVLSQECENPDTPLEYFLKYFPEEFWEECAFQTNLYSVQREVCSNGRQRTEDFCGYPHYHGDSQASEGQTLLVAVV